MAQEAEKITINAIPSEIRWKSGIGHVVFRCCRTGNCFMVRGMTIKGGKGAWAQYNRKFKGKLFAISLNAGGQGVHYAEGIRWDDCIRKWVDVLKPEPYLGMVQVTRETYETQFLVDYRWNPISFNWDEISSVFSKKLYRSILDGSTLKCWDCYSRNKECECDSVPDIRKMVEGFSSKQEADMCGSCFRWHTTPQCLVCHGDYTQFSLNGGEYHCPICIDVVRSYDLVVVANGCGHAFHEDCLEKWRLMKNDCPVCHMQYPPLMNDGDSYDGDSDSDNVQLKWHSDSDSDNVQLKWHSDSYDGDSDNVQLRWQSDSSDGDDYDPMDDCSDCGNPNSPCLYNQRHR